MLYVLYGTERLLMDQRLDKLKKDHHCNQEQMNYTVYDVSKEGMKVVLEDVMTPPFLSDEKMVVIKKADFLTTKKQTKFILIFTRKAINKNVIIVYIQGTTHTLNNAACFFKK